MPLNAKLKAHIDEQVAAGKMTKEYGEQLSKSLGDLPDDFQGGWLRQSDYDRLMNEGKSKLETADKWITWEKEARPRHEQMQKDLTAKEVEIADLKAKVASGVFTPREEDAMAKEIGELKTTIVGLQGEMKKTIEGSGFIKQTDLDNAYSRLAGFMGEQVLTLQDLNRQHRATFDKELSKADSEALFTFANDKTKELGHPISLEQAYKMKYEADYQKVWEEKKTAEITKDVQSRLNTPVPGGGAPPEKGPLQIRMEQTTGKDLVPGNDSLVEAKAKAAAALRAEGKF